MSDQTRSNSAALAQNGAQQRAKPLAVLRDGAVKATIWENQGEKGPYLSTKFAKTYQDGNGQVKDTGGFSQSDLLKVSELARQAYHENRELRQDFAEQAAAQEQAPTEQQQRRSWGRRGARPGGDAGR